MGAGTESLSGQITSFYKAIWMDLPVAASTRLLGGPEKELRSAGWQAYDSWVALANEATNRLYANRTFADFSARLFEATLRWQEAAGQLIGTIVEVAPQNPALPPAEYAGPVRVASGLTRPAGRPAKRRSRRIAAQSPADATQNRETDRAVNG